MAASNEGTELKLVSSIRYKFAAVSGNEKKLSEALQSSLTSLLERAGSQHKAVREDTFKAFMSVKNFVQPSGVVLPVAALLEQYKRTTSPIVKQLDLALIREGMSRLDQSKRRSLLPVVLRDISRETNSASAAGFFNVFLRLLLEIKVPGRGSTEDLALRESVGLSNSSDAKYVASWLGKLFLLRQDIALAAEDEIPAKLAASPSGLTKEDVAFLRNKDPKSWQPSIPNSLSLPECKTKAVAFLASGAFRDDERHLPMICAAGSADSRVSSVADDVLKRSSVDLESESVVQSLFVAHNTFPAAHRIQILRLLSKSVVACTPKQQVVDAVKEDFALTTGEKPPIVGLEALRLHKAILGFLSWIARNSSGSKTADTKMGPALVVILKDYILGQGWPAPNPRNNQSQSQDEQRLRANAYETIGTLARVSSLEQKAKDSLLKWLFDSLVSDPSPDIVVYIESALSSMMGLFKSTDVAQHRDLEVLLLEYMNLPERQNIRTARHVAVRFANNCLPYNNIKARWIGILALAAGSSERRDILEEGQRGLDPWWATKLHPEENLQLPDWEELGRFLFDSTARQIEEYEMAVDQTSKYALYSNDRLQAFPIAIRFLKQIFFLTALAEKDIEIDWESRLETQIHNDLSARHAIREYIKTVEPSSILLLLNAAFDGLRDHPNIGVEDCIACLADILSFAPAETIISSLSGRTHELLPLRGSNNQRVRQLVSNTFGILAPWDDQASPNIAQLRELLSSTEEPPASLSAQYQCSLTCLASYLSRATFYGRISSPDIADHIQFVNRRSFAALMGSDTGVQNAALDSLAQLWTADIGWPSQDNDLNAIIDRLASLAAQGNEKSIYALGRLAMPRSSELSHSEEESPGGKALKKLFGLSEIKRTEVHFAIGEAIAAAIARWDSDSVRLSIDVQPSGHGDDIIRNLRKKPEQVRATLDKFINDCKETKPSLIKASGIWLFCVIQYCSSLPDIQSRLRDCQVAFMRLLTARDELVQETASRGLALVYEKGDASLKGDLVKDLVGSFTGTKTQLKVDDDTELFDAGALPTGEGKSITSYKDIINLANEVGDQSLIYKFMALATNAATWTARSAFGRFGLSTILSDAELDPKIYPKLYRYRFDPNPNVRRSMEDIWKAVVKDETVTIDVHFDAIMADLLKSILDGREWRVREASCAAISDLIGGQPYLKYEKYYVDIWQVALRVLDDQKGSVREAALKLCIGLSKTLVSQLRENNSSSSAQAMIAQVLPFLLSDKGIENSVQEVKLMAITTVLDVVKDGGDTLKPFIPTITTHFLGLLSTIESGQVNYYYQRVSEEDREGLDKIRSTIATRSPLFECISNCLRFTDEAVMSQLAPQLITTIKSALGMQTKIGCSEVLSTLALRHNIFITPYNAMFVKSLHTQILDRNNEVSKAYAKSAAYLLRSASPETRDRYTTRLVDLYFAAEDEVRRQKVADAVLAIAKVSPDAFTDLETRLLPFAYFAKFDTDEYVSEVCEAAWNQHAGGDHTVKRYVNEISSLVSKGLETSKWALQHAAAFTVASMLTALSKAAGKGGQFNESALQQIWPVLDKALSLKTFKGKERLVSAYPLFIRHGKKLWEVDSATSAQTKKIAIREAKRNNDEYRPSAFEALAEYAAVREDLDMYAEVVALVSEYLTPDGEAHKLTELERKATEAALKAVLTAYNRSRMRSAPTAILSEVVTVAEGAKQSISIFRDTLFTSTLDLLDEAGQTGVTTDTDESLLATRWFRLLLHDEAGVVLESQRAARAKTLLAFAASWKKGVFGAVNEQGSLHEEIEQKLTQMKAVERSLDVQRLLDQVLQELRG